MKHVLLDVFIHQVSSRHITSSRKKLPMKLQLLLRASCPCLRAEILSLRHRGRAGADPDFGQLQARFQFCLVRNTNVRVISTHTVSSMSCPTDNISSKFEYKSPAPEGSASGPGRATRALQPTEGCSHPVPSAATAGTRPPSCPSS